VPVLSPLKVATGSIASIANLCSALDISKDELDQALGLNGAERYTKIEIPKKDGSMRVVYKPHHLLRKIQRRLNKRIFSKSDIIVWPDHLYGSIPNQETEDGDSIGKDYVACARQHCRSKSILSIDIENFFDNIHQSFVEDIFSKFFKYDAEVSNVLADICCAHSHVIQGALTSSYIASLCLWDVEGGVVEKLARKGLTYTRLVDDISISSKISNYNFDFAQSAVQDMLSSKDLPVNTKKTRIQHLSTAPLIVHGLRVAFEQPRLPSEEVRKIRSAVKNVETLAIEKDYRTTHAYRHDFNRCMGRVNKLERVGHHQHKNLVGRLQKILPLPSKKDIERTSKIVERLENDFPIKGGTYWYWKRFHLAHERLNVLRRSFPVVAKQLREKLKNLKSSYE